MKLLAGLWSFEGLSEAGGTFYNCTLGCCLEASVPHHTFFIRAFGVFSRHRSWLSPEGVIKKKKKQAENYNAFYELISGVAFCHFCFFSIH